MSGNLFPDGEGLFETILTIDGEPQFVAEHLERAKSSASLLGWQFPDNPEITSAVSHVIASSPARCGRLRLIFTPDGKIEGAHTFYEKWVKPARVTLSSRTIDENSPRVSLKILPYRENMEILEEARRCGFDDAIRFNSRGEVAESSIANLFLKVEGRWVTPPVDAGILPGIMRAVALKCALVEEGRVFVNDLPAVESIFLVNSLKGFQPVEALDSQALAIDQEFLKIIATLPQFGSVG